MGRTFEEEWNSGCDRPKQWQVYFKLVGPEFNAPNAPKVLGKLPDVTAWAYNALTGHRSDIVSHKLSKVEDARLGMWTSAGYAKQVVGRAGTKGIAALLLYIMKLPHTQ